MLPIALLTIADESSRDFIVRLYHNCKAQMYREAKRYLGCEADAEDAVSEAVVKLVDKLELLRSLEERKRLAYAITTVRHFALRSLERRNQTVLTELDEIVLSVPAEDDPEARILKEQGNRRLQELLVTLPLQERLLLEKKYILLWSDAEIAELLEIKPDSVRMSLTRAKRKLAKALAEQGFYPEEWF